MPEIKEYELENIFNEIVYDVHDKSEAVSKIIKDSGAHLSDIYFIGDSNHEIDVSKKLGIKSVAVTWGFTSESKLRSHNPDYVATDVNGLEKILLTPSI